MILSLDIGGTKVAVATFAARGELEPVGDVRRYPSKDFPGLTELLQSHFGARPSPGTYWVAAIGLAGPVLGRKVQLTNLPWTVDADQISAWLGCPVFLLNDLAAHAYAVPVAKAEHSVCLRKGEPKPGNIALIAAGTGLGEAILFWDGEKYHASASEGGHASFSPTNEEEASLLSFTWKKHHHVSWERVCSGLDGFRSIFEYLESQGRTPANLSLAGPDIGPEVVTAAERGDEWAREVVRIFTRLYAAEAGNLALKAMAVGGVYFAGGIAPRILASLQHPDFLTQFAAKGRFRGMLDQVPLYVFTDPLAALRGGAAYARSKSIPKKLI